MLGCKGSSDDFICCDGWATLQIVGIGRWTIVPSSSGCASWFD